MSQILPSKTGSHVPNDLTTDTQHELARLKCLRTKRYSQGATDAAVQAEKDQAKEGAWELFMG